MHYYLIINEGLSSGLTASQVVRPIQYNRLEAQVGVVSIEKPGKRTKKLAGMRYKIIPFGIPYRLFLFNNLAYILVPWLAVLYALIISLLVKKGDILVARSYFPGIVLYYLKKISGNTYKFDPRSLFVHESVTKGLISENSPLFRKWLEWEKLILENADLVIVVAQKQKEYYLSVTSCCPDIVHIPCYASGVSLSVTNSSELLPFSSNDIVIAYYGSLDQGWNNVDIYLKLFDKAILQGYKICLISQNFKQLRLDSRFQRPEIFILDTINHTNHAAYLQACDYGVVVMPKVSDWETRLSVKFAEYVSNGLGVLVGEYVGEAVRLSEEYFSQSNLILNSETKDLNLRKFGDLERSEIRRTANDLFSLSNFTKVL